MKIATLPSLKKVTPLFLSNPPLKVEVLSSPTLFENLVGGSTPPPSPAERRGGGCTLCTYGCFYDPYPSYAFLWFKILETNISNTFLGKYLAYNLLICISADLFSQQIYVTLGGLPIAPLFNHYPPNVTIMQKPVN